MHTAFSSPQRQTPDRVCLSSWQLLSLAMGARSISRSLSSPAVWKYHHHHHPFISCLFTFLQSRRTLDTKRWGLDFSQGLAHFVQRPWGQREERRGASSRRAKVRYLEPVGNLLLYGDLLRQTAQSFFVLSGQSCKREDYAIERWQVVAVGRCQQRERIRSQSLGLANCFGKYLHRWVIVRLLDSSPAGSQHLRIF